MGLPGEFDKLKDKDKVVVLQQRIQFQNETIENQKNQVTEVKADSAQLRDQIEKLSDSIQNQTGIIAEQQTTLKDQETTILEQQKTISELQKQLISLQKNLENVTAQVIGMETKALEKTKNLQLEIEKVKQELDAKQKDYNTKIIEREETIKALMEENVNLERGVKELSAMKLGASPGDAGASQRVLELEKALEDADNTLANLGMEHEQQKQNLQSEIALRDVKIEQYERLIKQDGISAPTASNFVSDATSAIVTIASIFSKTKSTVMVFLPEISALNDLDFDAIRSVVRVSIAVPARKDPKLIEKWSTKPNIEIRDYTGDIWGIIRDNAEMLLAPLDERGVPSGLVMNGDSQIAAFGTVIRSLWTRLKRV